MRCCGTCRAVYRSGFDRCPTDGTELSPFEHDPVVGTTIDDLYEVEECVGQGAMGRVYRAHHLRLQGRQVALKILLGDLASSVEMRMRFTQEAQAASLLSHPNVVPVLDFGKTPQGLLYMAMEYVEGTSLAHIITREGPLAAERVVYLARQLCLGLGHAHSQGLIHRDFKPDNVIVVDTPAGEVPRIADFGLAIFSDTDRNSARLTSAGTVVGTPLYTAPEQALDRGLDHRVDLFALGVTMFEMLAGCPPFGDGSPVEILHNNLAAPRPAIARRAPGVVVPQALERIVQKLMSSDRDLRYPSAHAVVHLLDQLGATETSHQEANRTTTLTIFRRPHRVARQVGLAALGGAVALALVAMLRPGAPDRSQPAMAPVEAPDARAGALAAAAARALAPSPAPVPGAEPAVRPLVIAPPAATSAGGPAVRSSREIARPPARSLRQRAAVRSRASRGTRVAAAPALAQAEPPAGGVTAGEPDASLPAAAEPGGSRAGRAGSASSPSSSALAATAPITSAGGGAGAATPAAAPGAVGTPLPQVDQPSRRSDLQRDPSGPAFVDARPVIDGLAVEGSLSDAEVRRGILRVEPRLAACYRAAARRTGRAGAGDGVRVTFTIDENGRAREIGASGGALPGISSCVGDAIAAVRTRIAPDVGDVRVSVRVGFSPREER